MGNKIYCKKCGSELDNTKKCTGCGKKYFKFKISHFIMFLLVIIIFLESYTIFRLNNNIVNLSFEFETTKKALEQEKENHMETRKKYIDTAFSKDEEAMFWSEHAVIVSNNGTKKYHYYGCEDLMLNSFWIYNTDAAEGQGYTLCSKCYLRTKNNL